MIGCYLEDSSETPEVGWAATPEGEILRINGCLPSGEWFSDALLTVHKRIRLFDSSTFGISLREFIAFCQFPDSMSVAHRLLKASGYVQEAVNVFARATKAEDVHEITSGLMRLINLFSKPSVSVDGLSGFLLKPADVPSQSRSFRFRPLFDDASWSTTLVPVGEWRITEIDYPVGPGMYYVTVHQLSPFVRQHVSWELPWQGWVPDRFLSVLNTVGWYHIHSVCAPHHFTPLVNLVEIPTDIDPKVSVLLSRWLHLSMVRAQGNVGEYLRSTAVADGFSAAIYLSDHLPVVEVDRYGWLKVLVSEELLMKNLSRLTDCPYIDDSSLEFVRSELLDVPEVAYA